MSLFHLTRLVRRLRRPLHRKIGNRVARSILRVEQFEDRVTPSHTVAIAAASLTGPEGSPIALTSTVTGATSPTYAWTVVKDGAATAYATGTDANFTFTPNDNGSYVVTD